MIQKKTYDDLRLLLDTLEGLPYESQKDIAYVDAVRLIVDRYEEDNMRRKSPHELIKSILGHLKRSPDDIVKILKKDREAGLKKMNKKSKLSPITTKMKKLD